MRRARRGARRIERAGHRRDRARPACAASAPRERVRAARSMTTSRPSYQTRSAARVTNGRTGAYVRPSRTIRRVDTTAPAARRRPRSPRPTVGIRSRRSDIPHPMGRLISTSAHRRRALFARRLRLLGASGRVQRDLRALSAGRPDPERRVVHLPVRAAIACSTFWRPSARRCTSFVAANLQTYIYGRGISSIIALVFLVWSSKNLFMGLAFALDRALNVPNGRPFFHNVALSIVMLPVMALILMVAMALPIVISHRDGSWPAFPTARTSRTSRRTGSRCCWFLSSTMVLYRFLPNRRISWGFSLPGALLVAVLWPIVQFAFTQYTLHVNFTGIYGALSVPLALLLWFYVIGIASSSTERNSRRRGTRTRKRARCRSSSRSTKCSRIPRAPIG